MCWLNYEIRFIWWNTVLIEENVFHFSMQFHMIFYITTAAWRHKICDVVLLIWHPHSTKNGTSIHAHIWLQLFKIIVDHRWLTFLVFCLIIIVLWCDYFIMRLSIFKSDNCMTHHFYRKSYIDMTFLRLLNI